MAGVSVKIGADSSQFQRAMRDMTQSLKATESELNLASEKARLFGSNTDYLRVQIDTLTSRLEAQNSMLGMQREYISTLNADITALSEKQEEVASTLEELNAQRQEAIANYGVESEEVSALDEEITALNAEYQGLSSNLSKLNSKLNNANIKFNNSQASILKTQSSLNSFNQQLKTSKIDSFNNAMGEVSEKSGAVASALTPVSLGLVAVGGYSAYASIKFSDALAKLSTIADTSKVSISQFKQQILALSNQTGISATSIAEDAYQAISAGVKTGNTMDFVTKCTRLSTAGFADSGQALDLLTTILNAYGMKESDVNMISNDLIRTQNLGKTTVGQLAQSMGLVIPMAHDTGVSLQQLSSAYVMMTAKGVDTAESTTEIRSMLSELSKDGSKSAKILKSETGESFTELMKKGDSLGQVLNILQKYAQKNGTSLKNMFSDVRAGNGALELATNGGQDFNNILSEMSKKGNDTNEAFEKVTNTTGYKLKKSLNDLRNSSIKLGDQLQPVISHIAVGITDVANSIQKLSPSQLKMITDVGLAIVSFTLFAKTLSVVTGGLKTVGTGISNTINFFTVGEDGVSTFTKSLNFLKTGLTGV